MNTEGGTLLIGVEDDGTIFGIEADLNNKPKDMQIKDIDNYGLLFRNTFLNYLGAEFSPFAQITFERDQEHTIAVVKVERSPKPVYLRDKNDTEYYIRAGNTTKLLDVQSATSYITMNWEL